MIYANICLELGQTYLEMLGPDLLMEHDEYYESETEMSHQCRTTYH